MENESDTLSEAKRRAYPDDDCNSCIKYRETGGPSHNGSKGCKSLSIASGGFRTHCSCNACW